MPASSSVSGGFAPRPPQRLYLPLDPTGGHRFPDPLEASTSLKPPDSRINAWGSVSDLHAYVLRKVSLLQKVEKTLQYGVGLMIKRSWFDYRMGRCQVVTTG